MKLTRIIRLWLRGRNRSKRYMRKQREALFEAANHSDKEPAKDPLHGGAAPVPDSDAIEELKAYSIALQKAIEELKARHIALEGQVRALWVAVSERPDKGDFTVHTAPMMQTPPDEKTFSAVADRAKQLFDAV